MQAVILAGGFGTRLSEETISKPKPLVEIGGRPILWHIMKTYSYHGINDFIICGGYKCEMIKEYFFKYHILNSDVKFNTYDDTIEFINRRSENWNVTVVDTGLKTQTGGRLKSVQDLLTDGTFFFTYGDGVADINITATLKAHKDAGRKATMSLAKPDGRFGAVTTNKHGQVTNFIEKPKGDGSYVNAGYFVLDHTVIDYITGPEISWEAEPLTYLTEAEELTAYKHNGFWKPMDTLRDKNQLEHLWNSRRAPWKVW